MSVRAQSRTRRSENVRFSTALEATQWKHRTFDKPHLVIEQQFPSFIVTKKILIIFKR